MEKYTGIAHGTKMELMKNGLSKPAIIRIASALSKVFNDFPQNKFIELSQHNIEALELKARVNHLILTMHQFMPDDFNEAANALQKIESYWDFGHQDDPHRAFAAWPIIDYIAHYGLSYPEKSLATLKILTELFSAEFAIRPFISQHHDYCYQQFKLWARDESEHVRRLVSEGTRPRLPWGEQLKQFIEDPQANLPLLDQLKNDESLYVRRSVANHLNDIAKDHSELVINTCQRWLNEANTQPSSSSHLQWVIKHATRSLIKSGHPEVFSLLGYTKKPLISVSQLKLSSNNIAMGEALCFQFAITSEVQKIQNLVVDFAIHFVKANGEKRPKVFKLKNVELKANEKISFEKRHAFKLITTRKYYTGEHVLEVLVNGKAVTKQTFNLLT